MVKEPLKTGGAKVEKDGTKASGKAIFSRLGKKKRPEWNSPRPQDRFYLLKTHPQGQKEYLRPSWSCQREARLKSLKKVVRGDVSNVYVGTLLATDTARGCTRPVYVAY